MKKIINEENIEKIEKLREANERWMKIRETPQRKS